MKILMVLTSHGQLGDSGEKTGFWLEELAAPWYVFRDADIDVVLASPAGGKPPLDPKSSQPEAQSKITERFNDDEAAQQALANTHKLAEIDSSEFDAVFYPGGHGPLWDLAEDKQSIALIETFYANQKPVGTVCHAPGVLRHVRKPDGTPLVQGKRVTGFTNSEEKAVGLLDVVPFLVEDELKRLGGQFERTDDWGAFTLTDGHLVTGQNPGSSEVTAEALLKLLHQ